MKLMSMTVAIAAACLAVVLPAGCSEEAGGAASVSADGRCEHEIKAETCPFCNPEMVEAEGFCGAHGFPEAICAQCKPGIKVAFRAQGDWCEEHKLPESQCVACNSALAENIQPGVHGGAMPTAAGEGEAGNCEHGIAAARCPFCDPSLIESEGFCNGHGVAEALCVKCRPFMMTAFQAKGDWCAEHGTPESQCTLCGGDGAEAP